MADIKSYMKEKEKREHRQEDYREKIARHKLSIFYKILGIVIFLVIVALFFYIQYKRRIYTDYDITTSVDRESISGTTDVRLGNAVLTYSKDGAHCTGEKGNVNWNQTFQIQDARLSVSGRTVAIGDYNGRNIYIADSEKLIGEITTAMPIRDLAVSETGHVTAVLDDGDVTWINTYNSSGELEREGRTHMDDSGYPMAVSMSPGGELLAVAYVYVDAGVLKTNIAFYNFGPVGSNVSDFLVSSWGYTDMLIPYVRFMNDSTAFAVGDSRLMIYSGNHEPAPAMEHLYDREVQSVFYNDRYIGLVFFSDKGESRYQMDVYDTANVNSRAKSFYFDLDYTDIFFGKGNFVVYNETECLVMSMDGTEKYRGDFMKPVRLMVPTGSAYRFMLITDDTMDTIQLK